MLRASSNASSLGKCVFSSMVIILTSYQLDTPRTVSRASTITSDIKSIKSASSKETTRIPKPKSVVRDTKPVQTRCTSKPPEDKKFSIHRQSKTVVIEKPDHITKLGESRIEVFDLL